MLLQKWLFPVTIWVLIVGRGTADSGELLGYGIPSPTACLNGPCQPLLSPPLSSLPGYPSYGTPPPPPSPFPGYPFYRGPPPPSPHISSYPSYGAPPPPTTTPAGSGYPSYGAPPPPTTTPAGSGYPSYGAPPPPTTTPIGSGHPSYGAPSPPPKQPTTSSSPGQGCLLPPFQSCSNGPPTPYEYLPNQNHSVPPSLPLSWFSVMVLSLPFAFLL